MNQIVYGNAQSYANPSRFAGIDDSHVFVEVVYGNNQKDVYSNGGGTYGSESRLVAEGLIYNTWLQKYMPNKARDFRTTGVEFAYNGVCQTYASRELLFTVNNKDPYLARANDVCVMYYGKYGCGLKYFEKKLRESFEQVRQIEWYQNEILERVVARIYDTLDEEVEAWIRVMKQYLGLDATKKFKNPNDWNYLRNKVSMLISKREAIFDNNCDYNAGTFNKKFLNEKKDMYISEVRDYLNSLVGMGYFTQTEAKEYVDKFENLLRSHQNYYMEMRNNMANVE